MSKRKPPAVRRRGKKGTMGGRMLLSLEPPLKALLEAHSKAAGLSASEYIRQALRERLAREPWPKP